MYRRLSPLPDESEVSPQAAVIKSGIISMIRNSENALALADFSDIQEVLLPNIFIIHVKASIINHFDAILDKMIIIQGNDYCYYLPNYIHLS